MSFAAMPIGLGLFNCPVPAVLPGSLMVPTFDEFEAGLDGYSQGDYDFPEDGRVNPLGCFLENEPSSEGFICASESLLDVADWFRSRVSESCQTPVMSPLDLECPGAPCKAGVEFVQDSADFCSIWLGSPVLGLSQTPVVSPLDLECPGAPCKASIEFIQDFSSVWLGSPVLGSFQTPVMSPLDLECPGAPRKAGVEFAPDSFSMEDISCDTSLSPYLFADISCFETGLLAYL